MVTVRDAQPTDHLTLRSIQQNTLPEPSPELLDTAVHGPLGLLVAAEGEPVGYALFVDSGETALLLELAVAPDHQGEGIGTALLDATLARLEATETTTVRLTARAVDTQVQRFYERNGFQRERVIEDYFDSGAAVVFTRRL